MKENEILGNNKEHPEHYEVLSGLSLLISRSGKNRKTEGLQGKKVKKTTSCNTDLCVTQGRLFLIFSWVLSGYQFLPFWKKLRMRGVTLKYLILLPLNCGRGFGGYIVDYAVYALYLVYYSAGGGVKHFIWDSCPVRGHKVAGHNRS